MQNDNVSGAAARDRDPPIRDFFPKTESELTRSSCNGLAAVGRRRMFFLARTVSVIGGNSEVSALREFFAV
jgi:hypothetical protein